MVYGFKNSLYFWIDSEGIGYLTIELLSLSLEFLDKFVFGCLENQECFFDFWRYLIEQSDQWFAGLSQFTGNQPKNCSEHNPKKWIIQSALKCFSVRGWKVYIHVCLQTVIGCRKRLSIHEGLRVITQLKMDLLDLSESVYFMF